ncbi:tetraacyldisaccharide 4'-kinase [Raineya orbicola]|jgi:tetraacyldisaccharide 4'-kinase|uniref:Tetraacyldisaccharide 4'-kinase n=1 Tax=Raineya orbicola TaxID=2016530 RepID=A0A2N3I8W9_9BACT|nr:tetraacyldisaccharide 4'-kinase [Raineya orbicola]PKQ66725.1 lpxK: tetraacyldisaccharide 4'-kinase [Raineya orbicola]
MRYLLLPFAILYGLITDLRNWLYDTGRLKSVRFDLPTIGVGNLRVGGTGKTPFIEYLIHLFASEYKIATLSRGYGRKTKGFRLATPQSSAQEIGDEPLQLYAKFGDKINVCVGEERILAIPELLALQPETQMILLDDVFQHRSIKPHLQILLTDYKNLFYQDYLLPMGRLRESRKQARRADLIIVTKCPQQISETEKENIKQNIQKYAPACRVLFTHFKYGKPRSIVTQNEGILQKVALVSGIAQPHYFERDMREHFNVQKHFIFPDHYFFSRQDVAILSEFLEQNPETFLLCTEKDAVKLQKMDFLEKYKSRIFCIGLEVSFLDKEDSYFFRNFLQERLKFFQEKDN